MTASLPDPLDRLDDQIRELLDVRTGEQRLALYEVLALIESLQRELAEIAAEHVPGRVYGKPELGRQDEVYELARAARSPEELEEGLRTLAERDVVVALGQLRAIAPPFDYRELACLGRRLATAATLISTRGLEP